MSANISHAKSFGPCHSGCDCVPPASSYDYRNHSTVACCKWSGFLPDGTLANCDKKRLPTADHDRGKDYNHSTFLDVIIEGLVGIHAFIKSLFVVHPLADAAEGVSHFALDNLCYHNHNISVIWDPNATAYPLANCTGLCVFVDGTIRAQSRTMARLEIAL